MDSIIITSPDLARCDNQQFMNLETFRKNGEGVESEVEAQGAKDLFK